MEKTAARTGALRILGSILCVVLLMLVAASCSSTGKRSQGAGTVPTVDSTADSAQRVAEELADRSRLPSTRSFYIGFTPFPSESTPEAIRATHEVLTNHGDIWAYHNDQGVPWYEAAGGRDFTPRFHEATLEQRTAIPDSHIRYVSCTPTNQERHELAPYKGAEDNLPLNEEWRSKKFSDPDVIEAYINWCRYLLDHYHPKYFCYGIELNATFTMDDPKLHELMQLYAVAYPTLKEEYPDVPIFIEFQTGSFGTSKQEYLGVTEMLLEYSDFIGISTYPFIIFEEGVPNYYRDPREIPANYLDEFQALAPDKPIAVTETGYIAETLDVRQYDWHAEGSPLWQAIWVDWFFRELNRLDAVFVIQFVPRDYDKLYDWITANQGEVEFFKLWRDTGLWDGEGNPRPALTVWDAWLALPRENPH